jgi:hypothetical protein
MAQSKRASSNRRSDRSTRSGRSDRSEEATRSGGTGRGGGNRALSAGAGSSERGASNRKGAGTQVRKRSTASAGGRGGDSAAKEAAEPTTGAAPSGRPASDEPDVFVDVPGIHVGKLEIDVERLEAHLALRAQVANLVNLVAGVHVGVDKVKINIEDVDASATVTVRLQNVYNILERTLTTIDENPEILQGVIDTAGSAVGQVGEIGREATKPGGAVSALTSGVGDTLDSLGDTLSSVTDKLSPKGLLAGARRGGSQAKSNAGRSADGMLAKAAAGVAAGGAAGVLGGALYRTQKRPRVLGIPVGRARGLERVAKRIGKLSGQVDSGRKELNKARSAAEKLVS